MREGESCWTHGRGEWGRVREDEGGCGGLGLPCSGQGSTRREGTQWGSAVCEGPAHRRCKAECVACMPIPIPFGLCC